VNHSPAPARGPRRRLALVLAGSLVLSLTASPVSGEQTFGYKQDTQASFDGLRGNQGIRTDPATVQGVGFVHTAQLDVGAVGGDFVAIGTANGLGTSFCEDDYDPRWTVFHDRVIGAVYACVDHTLDTYTTGDNPSFEILYKFCVAAQANRWVLTLGGVQRTCISSASTGGTRMIGMLETTGGSATDRNIDVKWTNMNRNTVGFSTWTAFGTPSSFVAPSYSYQFVSTTAFNTYLAPLN
jgi:hypothetical protein